MLDSLQESRRWEVRKMRRLEPTMEDDQAQFKLAAVAAQLGREIRVFTNAASATSQSPNEAYASNEESEGFYDFTHEDYYRIMSGKLGAQSQVLKTRKIREAEAAARRARITTAMIRVRFPDGYILEAKFQPSDKVQDLIDLLMKAIARPDLPFYLYTTPPKQRIKDASIDFYAAGFAPGAIVYFSYDIPKGVDVSDAKAEQFLREDIMSLNGLELVQGNAAPPPVIHVLESVTLPRGASDDAKPAEKLSKSKWFKR